jgi:D-glycero-D-manno-heptose 1,7-bisphosphate phosphatase
MRPAVFLDRDGTLIEDVGFLDRLDKLVLFPWTADAVRLLNRAGFVTVVVTNQGGIARGLYTEAFLREAHAALDERLADGGARIDRYYYCPHHPTKGTGEYLRACACRKPAPGMIHQACADLDLDPTRSWMIGDKWLDVGCGRAAGAGSLLVRTGYGANVADAPPEGLHADAILNNLMEAVGWILRTSTSR